MMSPQSEKQSILTGTKVNAGIIPKSQKKRTSSKKLLNLMTPNTMFIKALLNSMLKVKVPKSSIISREGKCG